MAFKMKGSAFKLNNVATKSALKQYVENVEEGSGTVSLDGTDYHKGEGQTIIPWSEEAEAAHHANVMRLSDMGLSQPDYDGEVAKTRHLPNPNPVVDEEPTVYPKNPKVKKRKGKGPKYKLRFNTSSHIPGFVSIKKRGRRMN